MLETELLRTWIFYYFSAVWDCFVHLGCRSVSTADRLFRDLVDVLENYLFPGALVFDVLFGLAPVLLRLGEAHHIVEVEFVCFSADSWPGCVQVSICMGGRPWCPFWLQRQPLCWWCILVFVMLMAMISIFCCVMFRNESLDLQLELLDQPLVPLQLAVRFLLALFDKRKLLLESATHLVPDRFQLLGD